MANASKRSWFRLLVPLSVLALALGLIACGSSDSDSDTSGGDTTSAETSGDGSAGLERAEKEVAQASIPPDHIGPTEPVAKPIPSGKKIVYISQGVQAEINIEEGIKEAGEHLGWTVTSELVEPTPQAIQQGFEAALRQNPDAILGAGMARASFERQLAEMEGKDIPFISAYGPDPAGDGISIQIAGPMPDGSVGTDKPMELLADAATVDAGGEGEIGVAVLTGFPTPAQFAEAFEAQLGRNCPDCTTKQIEIAPTSIGKTSETDLANFLRANPDMDQLYLTYDGIAGSMDAALKSAGVEPPKIYTFACSGLGLEKLRNGETTACVPEGHPELGWQMVDAAARIFTGESPDEDNKLPRWSLWGKELGNMPPEPGINPPTIKGFQSQFEDLWTLAG